MITRALRFCIPPRLVLLSFGGLCLALGIVGAFIPVMPSMVFLVVALWAFSKGSEWFHTWLYEHRFFGPPLQDWCEHRAVAPRSKLVAVGGMALSSGIVIAMFPLGSVAPLIYCGLNVAGAVFVLSRPSRPSSTEDDKTSPVAKDEKTPSIAC